MALKLTIKDRIYELEGLDHLTIADLIMVKQATGLNLNAWQRALSQPDEDGDIDLEAFGAFIWMCRRHAGERIDFETAISDFALTDFSFEVTDENGNPVSPDDAEAPAADTAAPDPTAAA